MTQEKTPQITIADASSEICSVVETLPGPATSTTRRESVPKDFFFMPVPTYLRRLPDEPTTFSLLLNMVFAIAGTFLLANVYWCQPILIELAHSFHISYDKVSNVPTLIQAGYAGGLLFIAPLGDVVRRRPLVLQLAFASIALTFGVAFTRNFLVFEIFSFLIGIVSCAPQILLALAADICPPERRASTVSIIISGWLLGILLARVVSGLVAEFASWRVVYYVAIGLQTVVFAMLYTLVPDYPVRTTGISYIGILTSMAKFCVTEPLLIQSCLVTMAGMACFTNFWVTLTFLLGDAPYNYSTLVIGLFGLIGMTGVLAGPFVGRTIDNLVPWIANIVSTIGLLTFQAIQVGAGGVHIAAVIIVCFGLDVFRQMQQVSLLTAVFGIEPTARSRLNSIVLIAVNIGQIMGTSVGTKVFVSYGWRPAAALSVGWTAFCLFVLLVRGPNCSRYTWFGYEGGLRLRNPVPAVSTEPSQAADSKVVHLKSTLDNKESMLTFKTKSEVGSELSSGDGSSGQKAEAVA